MENLILNVNDLNQYLPALKSVEEINYTGKHLPGGLFWGKAIDGLKTLPDSSIDLIISKPFFYNNEGKLPSVDFEEQEIWIEESKRSINELGAFVLITPIEFSFTFQQIIEKHFTVQGRINFPIESNERNLPWKQPSFDLLVCYKGNSKINNHPDIKREGKESLNNTISDVMNLVTHKRNLVVDPFLNEGDIAKIAHGLERKFIGFEEDKNKLLMIMKKLNEGDKIND